MLTPLEIKKQEFSRAMRGYDSDEVRAFLESLADDFERLQETGRAQAANLERLKSELEAFQRMEQNLKEALVNAQETLREARDGSRREGELIKREAQIEAEKIIAESYKKLDDLRREVESLHYRRDALVRKLKSLLRSELELIELLEGEEVAPAPSSSAPSLSR